MRSPPIFPLVRELPSGLDAWQAFLALADLPGAVFFDSALRGGPLGRHSYVAADPFSTLCWSIGNPVDPLELLRAEMGPFAQGPPDGKPGGEDPFPGLPPFRGGAAGLLGYGLGGAFERIPPFRLDEFRLPDLALGLHDRILAFDHDSGRGWIVSQGLPEREPAARERRARARIDEVLERLARPIPSPAAMDAARSLGTPPSVVLPPEALAPAFEVPGRPGVQSSFSPRAYQDAVRRVVEHIRAGDVFQVNLAQRLMARQTRGALETYGHLRERNPAPFAGFFDAGGAAVLSASPERFLRADGDRIETRPIKGTRPRGLTSREDQDLREELHSSEKDRAENVMIVDLLRNDLSRVCRLFSVEAPELFRVETYRTVHQLVSVVRGRLRQGLGPLDLLRAAFPGGSITGAPKIRAMEIIAALEPVARGPYCGSLAWIGFDGSMDSSILIRTLTAAQGWLQLPAGGGITAPSDPEAEYVETLHKAEGMMLALE